MIQPIQKRGGHQPSAEGPPPTVPPPKPTFLFVDERDQPRSPSLADVLAKLQEIEEKIDALKDQYEQYAAVLISQEPFID